MKKIIFIIILFNIYNVYSFKDNKSTGDIAIEFTYDLISNAEIFTEFINEQNDVKFENNFDLKTIEIYRELLLIQKRNDYEFHRIEFEDINNKDSSLIIVYFKEKHNILYTIFIDWWTSSCNDTVSYFYEVRDKVIYFNRIQICPHTNLSD